MNNLEQTWNHLQQAAPDLALKAATALVIFLVGFWLSRRIKGGITPLLQRLKVDPTITSFLVNGLHLVVLLVTLVAALDQMGVQTSGLLTLFGAAGLAIGLSLQGSLSNLASGLLIVFFRPIAVGDYIEVAGTGGNVLEIQLMSTRLSTPDSKVVIIPNAKLFSEVLTNFSRQEQRRVDLLVGISYQADLLKAKEILQRLLAEHPLVLAEPAPLVGVMDLADSAVLLAVRPWVKQADYWPLRFDLLEKIKLTLDQEGIEIPYPQRDLHWKGPWPPTG